MGEGLVLRAVTDADAHAMHEAAMESAAELSTTMAWFRHDMGVEEFAAFGRQCEQMRASGTHFEWSINDADGTYLGSCGVTVDSRTKAANLQYWVRTTHTKRGVASRSARLLARWAIETLGLQRVEIGISSHNLPSQKAAAKSGARFEGILRNKIRWEDVPYDFHIYSFIPSDFDGVQTAT